MKELITSAVVATFLLLAATTLPTHAQSTTDPVEQVMRHKAEEIEHLITMLEESIDQERSLLDQLNRDRHLAFIMAQIQMAKELVSDNPLLAAQMANKGLATLQQYQLGDEQLYAVIREFIAAAIQAYLQPKGRLFK